MANIILDFDGTIHDCEKIYIPAFKTGYKYLVDNRLTADKNLSDKEIVSYLGCPPKIIWEGIAPDTDEASQTHVVQIVYEEMKKLTLEGKSELYIGAEEALRKLIDMGHKLFFLSNCNHNYMELHKEAHGLSEFYTDFFCSEDFGYIPKSEIFTHIKEKYNGDFIVVGDRYLDLDIAFKHGLKSIGCTYGYCKAHELDNASMLISDASQLPDAVKSLTA